MTDTELAPRRPATKSLDRIHVRLIDDDETDVRTFKAALGSATDVEYVIDHCPTLAAHLAEGSAAVDAIVIDLVRGDATNSDLTKLFAHPPATPTVVLTRLDDENIKLSALRAGAQDFLIKDSTPPDSLSKALRFAIERKRAQDLEGRLFRADRLIAVGQLAAGFAHEINNPATFMHAALELLSESANTVSLGVTKLRALIARDAKPEIQDAVDDLFRRTGAGLALADMLDLVQETRDGLERIRTTTRNMQSFSRIERNKISSVQLNDVIRVACAITDNDIRHRAKLILDLDEIPTIPGDAARLSQAIIHILIHSAKSIDGGNANKHRIKITSRCLNDAVVIEIESDGETMDAPTRARLFDPTHAVKQGTGGLGLPVCADIITRHRGTIAVTSEGERGARFAVTIPLDTGLDLSDKKPPTLAPIDISGARVLLIDDEDKIRMFVERSLAEVEFVLAPSGADAINVLKREDHFDAIVCDLMMPNGDGVDVYNHLAQHNHDLSKRIVFYTGGVLTPKAREFAAHAPRDFLQKPVTPRELRWAIADVMGRLP